MYFHIIFSNDSFIKTGWEHFFAVLMIVIVLSLKRSCEGQVHKLSLGQLSETYTTQCLEYTYFEVEATDACKDLTVEVCMLVVTSFGGRFPTNLTLNFEC